ncbi:MAG TPA: hypothetical protein VFS05_16240 [Gemmatimonadaceae bacterium]|nr:hypothetical protein [Gemmatimonadaceae bacterium]
MSSDHTVRVQLLESFPAELVPRECIFTPARPGDAGVDLHAAADVVLRPGERALIPTGIAVALPPGTEGQVRARSGSAARLGLGLVNGVGTIDEGFRAEIRIIAHNTNPVIAAEEMLALLSLGAGEEEVAAAIRRGIEARTIRIARGERVAQLVIARYERPAVELVDRLPDSERGLGGFGSTGVAGARR